MTKDSRRSSIAGSAAPLTHDNDIEGAHADPEKQPAIEDSGATPKHDGQSDVPAESQTTVPANTSEDSASAAAFASYGTRSRNRTGATRINYAEDKEMDFEPETILSKDNVARKNTKSGDSTTVVETTSSASNARRAPANESDGAVLQNGHKDSSPAITNSTANGTSQPASKKRKVAGQAPAASSTVSQVQTPLSVTPVPQATSGKAYPAPQLVPGFRETNMLGFERCRGQLKNKVLVADDGTRLQVNGRDDHDDAMYCTTNLYLDHVYLICEPPGEPYYLGRIMEFLHANNDPKQPIDALRLNWYYRPKDIGRQVSDTRQVFASMHSDISPLTALRGKCTIKHKTEVDKVDDYRKLKDSFWYEKLYDRYIHRYYDVVPTVQVINVPAEVKKVLDERWRYIIVEPGRGKELTSAVKSCKRCNKYCAR